MIKYAQQFFCAVAYNKNKNDYGRKPEQLGFLIRKLIKAQYVTEALAPSFQAAVKA